VTGEPDSIIRQFVLDWISLVAAGRYADALAEIDEPDRNGRRTTPTELQSAVQRSILGLSVHQLEQVRPQGIVPQMAIHELEDGLAYAAEYHLPGYGGWSDLTISFRFWAINSQLASSLEGIR
jgi:hypothetical protein